MNKSITSTVFSCRNKLSHGQLSALTTTALLTRLGFISQPHAGITHWLPMGLGTLNRLESLIRRRFAAAGLVETSLSALSHSSLWQKTNRWQNDELFKVGNDFCLAATAEEEITQLVSGFADTYKKMPLIVYQMTRKYRDEKRPRGGLLRGREFIMNDAYSFDVDQESALRSFEKMNEVYAAIFGDLRVPFVKANADAGSIGGDLSYEWHFVSDKGEDLLYTCDKCGVAGNVEKIRHVSEAAKNVAVTYMLTADDDLVALYYPAGRQLNPKFVEKLDLALNEKVKGDEVLKVFNKENEDGLKSIIRVMDVGVGPTSDLPDLPVSYMKSRMTTFDEVELTSAQEGDLCAACEEGHLHASHGIEVGHTFYLGTRYSKPLEATFVDSKGVKQFYEMGCYGIGVSRLLGSVAEVLRDEEGLRWPAKIAPVEVTLAASPSFGKPEVVEKLLKTLQSSGIIAEFDTSDAGLGLKLSRSKQCGIPLQVILGKSYPQIEIEVRGKVFGDEGHTILREKEWFTTVESRQGTKHLVDISHADEAIELLLKDM